MRRLVNVDDIEKYLIMPNGEVYEFMGIDPIGETILYTRDNDVIVVPLYEEQEAI
jgi:hypothetical protein